MIGAIAKAILRGSGAVLIVALLAHITGHGRDPVDFMEGEALVFIGLCFALGWWK